MKIKLEGIIKGFVESDAYISGEGAEFKEIGSDSISLSKACEYRIESDITGMRCTLYRRLFPMEEIYYQEELHRLCQFDGAWWLRLGNGSKGALICEMEQLKQITNLNGVFSNVLQ